MPILLKSVFLSEEDNNKNRFGMLTECQKQSVLSHRFKNLVIIKPPS